jgi:hypothetical protein
MKRSMCDVYESPCWTVKILNEGGLIIGTLLLIIVVSCNISYEGECPNNRT